MKKPLLLGVIFGGSIMLISGFWYVLMNRQAVQPMADTQKEAFSVEKNRTPEADSEQSERDARDIMVTNGVRHTVPLNEILAGGPPKDGIPSIDNPTFVSIQKASEYMVDEETGIAFSQGDTHRFYPFHILVWHEIVNDHINGQRILVTYCPLCLSGIVFDPVVNGERVEFGTSGKLWQSNLLMYDRKTESLWSQILGEAVFGDQSGNTLPILSSDIMRFGDWKRVHPQGQVLSRDTGASRFYGRDPYGDYYTSEGTIFPVRNADDRLEDKEFVLGLIIDGMAKAYVPEAVKKFGEVVDQFAGKTIIARHDQTADVVQFFERDEDGIETRINPIPNFWFSWVAVHPDTALFQ